MEPIHNLLEWATSNGVKLDGIEAKPLPGRGIGIVATRDLKAGSHILTIPTTIQRSLGNTPAPITQTLKGATVHAILSASLCLDTTSPDLEIWRAVFPSKEDVWTGMPICWPVELQALLPSMAKSLLAKQQAKFDTDWRLVSAAYPELLPRDYDFLYNWLLVNSRTFYHKSSKTEKLPAADHMVLQPVADLFNHSPDGCTASFNETAFTVITAHDHATGDELFLRYGSHANDFLLVEYGFTLPLSINRWDETSLDPYLCPRLSPTQREQLKDTGFWTGYMLDSETACYRTQTALRALCLTKGQWRAVLDGRRDEDLDREAVDAELLEVLRSCEEDVESKLVELDPMSVGTEGMRQCLRWRWVQIQELVVMTISRLQR